MAFIPMGGDHAIVEVVFGMFFSRPFAPNEIERVAAQHDTWRSHLPKMSRSSVLQMMMGDGVFPPADINFPGLHAGGITFERFKADGTLEWRLRIDQNSIFVNCLLYTRWAEIWPTVKDYLIQVSEIAAGEENLITALVLQYVDIFKWSGHPTAYNAGELFDLNGPFISQSVMNKGHLWHLHQGWFNDKVEQRNGRRLERVHIDAVEDEQGVPLVKIDTYIQHNLDGHLIGNFAFSSGAIDKAFYDMHSEGKALLSSLLTVEMCERIGLNVA